MIKADTLFAPMELPQRERKNRRHTLPTCLRKGLPQRAKPLVGALLVLTVWQTVVMLGVVSAYVLPAPLTVLRTLTEMAASGALWQDTYISLGRVFRGFAIAFLVAFVLGMFSAVTPRLRAYYDPWVQFLRNVPPMSLIPLLILWCGIGETTKTAVIALAAFFPVYLNIVKGFTGCDRKLLEVGTAFGLSKMESFFRISLPYAMSDILVGMRIGLGYSWRAIIGAEMVAASAGLGHMILFAQQTSRTDKVMAGIIAIGAVGYLTDRLFGLGIRKLLKGVGEHGWN